MTLNLFRACYWSLTTIQGLEEAYTIQKALLRLATKISFGKFIQGREAPMTALMLQRFTRIPSERVLADELAKDRDYRRICGFRRYTPSRACFTSFRRRRLGEERFKRAFEAMVKQAIALGAVKGYALSMDSTAFKAYSARDVSNTRGRSDPDADVGRAGRTYILGYRVHLACAEGDVPLAFTVQPISRNDKQFYKQLLEEAWKTGVKFRVVTGDRQYDSTTLRQWTKEAFQAETAIPTVQRKGDEKHGKALRVDAKFKVWAKTPRESLP